MVNTVVKTVITYASDPKVLTAAGAAGIAIMSTIQKNIIEFVPKEGKTETDPDIDLEFLGDDTHLKNYTRYCIEVYCNCDGTQEECDEELMNCLHEFPGFR